MGADNKVGGDKGLFQQGFDWVKDTAGELVDVAAKQLATPAEGQPQPTTPETPVVKGAEASQGLSNVEKSKCKDEPVVTEGEPTITVGEAAKKSGATSGTIPEGPVYGVGGLFLVSTPRSGGNNYYKWEGKDEMANERITFGPATDKEEIAMLQKRREDVVNDKIRQKQDQADIAAHVPIRRNTMFLGAMRDPEKLDSYLSQLDKVSTVTTAGFPEDLGTWGAMMAPEDGKDSPNKRKNFSLVKIDKFNKYADENPEYLTSEGDKVARYMSLYDKNPNFKNKTPEERKQVEDSIRRTLRVNAFISGELKVPEWDKFTNRVKGIGTVAKDALVGVAGLGYEGGKMLVANAPIISNFSFAQEIRNEQAEGLANIAGGLYTLATDGKAQDAMLAKADKYFDEAGMDTYEGQVAMFGIVSEVANPASRVTGAAKVADLVGDVAEVAKDVERLGDVAQAAKAAGKLEDAATLAAKPTKRLGLHLGQPLGEPRNHYDALGNFVERPTGVDHPVGAVSKSGKMVNGSFVPEGAVKFNIYEYPSTNHISPRAITSQSLDGKLKPTPSGNFTPDQFFSELEVLPDGFYNALKNDGVNFVQADDVMRLAIEDTNQAFKRWMKEESRSEVPIYEARAKYYELLKENGNHRINQLPTLEHPGAQIKSDGEWIDPPGVDRFYKDKLTKSFSDSVDAQAKRTYDKPKAEKPAEAEAPKVPVKTFAQKLDEDFAPFDLHEPADKVGDHANQLYITSQTGFMPSALIKTKLETARGKFISDAKSIGIDEGKAGELFDVAVSEGLQAIKKDTELSEKIGNMNAIAKNRGQISKGGGVIQSNIHNKAKEGLGIANIRVNIDPDKRAKLVTAFADALNSVNLKPARR